MREIQKSIITDQILADPNAFGCAHPDQLEDATAGTHNATNEELQAEYTAAVDNMSDYQTPTQEEYDAWLEMGSYFETEDDQNEFDDLMNEIAAMGDLGTNALQSIRSQRSEIITEVLELCVTDQERADAAHAALASKVGAVANTMTLAYRVWLANNIPDGWQVSSPDNSGNAAAYGAAPNPYAYLKDYSEGQFEIFATEKIKSLLNNQGIPNIEITGQMIMNIKEIATQQARDYMDINGWDINGGTVGATRTVVYTTNAADEAAAESADLEQEIDFDWNG
jgi:hypothetical protein